jgi:cell division control protein 6
VRERLKKTAIGHNYVLIIIKMFFEKERVEINMGLFDNLLRQGENFVKNIDVFEEEYIPEEVRYRSGNISLIAQPYIDFIGGSTPENILIAGGNGTGKTLCTRYVLEEFTNKVVAIDKKVIYHYANCRNDDTRLKIMQNFLKEQNIGKVPKRRRDVQKIFESVIENYDLVVFILDEFDRYILRYKDDAETFLYNCSRTYPNVHIIMITTDFTLDPYMRSNLDPSTKDTFRYKLYLFNEYTTDQLQGILVDRMMEGLKTEAWDINIVRYIVDKAEELGEGARSAINIAKNAIKIAKRRHAEKITEEHIDEVVDDLAHSPVIKGILSLRTVHLVVLMCIKEKEDGLSMEELKRKFSNAVGNTNYERSEGSLYNFVKYLEQLGFVRKVRKGSTMTIMINLDVAEDVARASEILKKSNEELKRLSLI